MKQLTWLLPSQSGRAWRTKPRSESRVSSAATTAKVLLPLNALSLCVCVCVCVCVCARGCGGNISMCAMQIA